MTDRRSFLLFLHKMYQIAKMNTHYRLHLRDYACLSGIRHTTTRSKGSKQAEVPSAETNPLYLCQFVFYMCVFVNIWEIFLNGMTKTHSWNTNWQKHNYQTDKITRGVFLPVVLLLGSYLYYIKFASVTNPLEDLKCFV